MIDTQFRRCPFIGLVHDRETANSYPSQSHRCFHVKPAAPVDLEYQNSFCLTTEYITCEVYTTNPASLPERIRGDQYQDDKWKRSLIILAGCLIVVVLVLALVKLGSSRTSGTSPLVGRPPLENPSSNLIEATHTYTIQPIKPEGTSTLAEPALISSATSLPPTLMPTAPSFRTLETPIGRNTQLIIHQVREGESLELIARLYATTIEAIRAINYSIPSPLLINSLVVVPYELTNVELLPAFQAFQVPADISVEVLAQQMNVDPSLLKQYNQLNDGEILKSGDWLLVPHLK
jgi:hypothetical protein